MFPNVPVQWKGSLLMESGICMLMEWEDILLVKHEGSVTVDEERGLLEWKAFSVDQVGGIYVGGMGWIYSEGIWGIYVDRVGGIYVDGMRGIYVDEIGGVRKYLFLLGK